MASNRLLIDWLTDRWLAARSPTWVVFTLCFCSLWLCCSGSAQWRCLVSTVFLSSLTDLPSVIIVHCVAWYHTFVTLHHRRRHYFRLARQRVSFVVPFVAWNSQTGQFLARQTLLHITVWSHHCGMSWVSWNIATYKLDVSTGTAPIHLPVMLTILIWHLSFCHLLSVVMRELFSRPYDPFHSFIRLYLLKNYDTIQRKATVSVWCKEVGKLFQSHRLATVKVRSPYRVQGLGTRQISQLGWVATPVTVKLQSPYRVQGLGTRQMSQLGWVATGDSETPISIQSPRSGN